MPKRRLGVVLLLPPAVAAEVDGLRRALGDGALGRIPAHITLVPPVNVRDDRLDDAVATLRAAADATRPFRLTLGPPATFLPVNPTLYLSIGGDTDALHRLRDRVFTGVLERTLTYPFVPHATVADGAEVGRIEHAMAVLSDYRTDALIDAVHLLEEGPDRVWQVLAAAPFRAPAVLGRGGIPLEVRVGSSLDPDASRFFDAAWAQYARQVDGDDAPIDEPITITGRRDGVVVGVATGELQGDTAYLARLITEAGLRGEGIGAALLAAFESEAARRGAVRLTLRTRLEGPAASFYRRHGWVELYVLPAWRLGRDFIQMERRLIP